jgi:protein-S-isoprenylcysteine O-methyltransferase Ste14
MQKFNQLIGHYRTLLSLFLAFIFFWLARPTLTSILWGVPFILLGEIIRTWASGCINKEYEQLTTWGPYAHTRNPLYVGNLFLGTGFVIMANQWIPVVLFILFFSLIYRSTIFDEENTLLKVFGQTFRDYKNRVPRFFPTIRADKNSKYEFYWERVFKHREYNAWLGIVIGIIIIFFKFKKGI